MRNHPLILIADDQPMLRQIRCVMLWLQKATQFIEASTGHQAIDLFRQHQPDIVLLTLSCQASTVPMPVPPSRALRGTHSTHSDDHRPR